MGKGVIHRELVPELRASSDWMDRHPGIDIVIHFTNSTQNTQIKHSVATANAPRTYLPYPCPVPSVYVTVVDPGVRNA